MGLLGKIFSNTRKPEGFFGRMMVNGMNGGSHAAMANWALSSVQINDDDRILDVGCGGGANIVRQLTDLLATGISRTERDVSYYAERLNVSTKYLSATVKRVTGHSVSSFIDRHTVPILKKYLNDERLSLTQIADRMNFTSLSYFSRYCTKHLGQSPSEYRRSLQPRG